MLHGIVNRAIISDDNHGNVTCYQIFEGENSTELFLTGEEIVSILSNE